MPKPQVGMQTLNTFRYTKDPDLNVEENLKIMMDCMRSILTNDKVNFEVTMSVMDFGVINAEEALVLINQAVEREKRLDSLEVHGMDKDGSPLYKAKK